MLDQKLIIGVLIAEIVTNVCKEIIFVYSSIKEEVLHDQSIIVDVRTGKTEEA